MEQEIKIYGHVGVTPEAGINIKRALIHLGVLNKAVITYEGPRIVFTLTGEAELEKQIEDFMNNDPYR